MNMSKEDKIAYARQCLALAWSCPEDSFTKNENVIFQSNTCFFEIVTFGHNAVIRADPVIWDWCMEYLSKLPAHDIMDGDNLYLLEKKLREYGKKLGGEHIRYLHLNTDVKVDKPSGFAYEWYEKDRISILYEDKRFDSALNYDAMGEVLALIARHDQDIAGMAAVDNYHSGLWQIGIDTVDCYRGRGLAVYLVKEMALESERREQIPFYTTWSPNIASTRTALGAGFIPVWVGYHAESV